MPCSHPSDHECERALTRSAMISHSTTNTKGLQQVADRLVSLNLVMVQTLIDNYEWNFAWMLKFGIFAWDEKKDPDYRHFRPSCAVRPAFPHSTCS